MNKVIKKHYIFFVLNIIAIVLLNIWIFKSCLKVNTSIISIVLDFLVLITFIYSLIRVAQSVNGQFKVLDMVSIYYASIIFLFSWYVKFLYLVWDLIWGHQFDILDLVIAGFVCLTLSANFVVTERENIKNLDKIESMDQDN
jgi:hypothetical protein